MLVVGELKSMMQTNILFVCLGNICRSPAAEGVFNSLLQRNNLTHKYYVDSAGTSGHHAGELADDRMMAAAKRRGIILTSKSRKFINEDFKRFDYIVVMDDSNLSNILKLDHNGEYVHKISKMTDYTSEEFSKYTKVPDPYYGGDVGFELVLDLLENTCKEFLKEIEKAA